MEKFSVLMHIDGACSGNPGPGAYAAKLTCKGKTSPMICGWESRTSCNRMGLLAVVKGLESLKKPCVVTVVTDNNNVCNTIANLASMPSNNYCTKTGAKRANMDLLKRLHRIVQEGGHDLSFLYEKGNPGGADCQKAAREQIRANGG